MGAYQRYPSCSRGKAGAYKECKRYGATASRVLTLISSRANFVWQLQHLKRGFNLLELGVLVH